MLKLPRVIAHRGASAQAPENTLAALQLAHELGASWVECDIQMNREQQLYVFHDRLMQRITGLNARLRRLSGAVIQQLDAGAWFDPCYQGEPIPSLASWLKTSAQLGLSVNFELKTYAGDSAAVMRELQRLIIPSRAAVPLLFSASSYHNLRALQQTFPDIPRAMVITRWRKHCIQRLASYQCASAHVNYKCLNAQRIDKIKQHGTLLAAYTVNDKALALKLLQQGVDAVFSDHPDLLAD